MLKVIKLRARPGEGCEFSLVVDACNVEPFLSVSHKFNKIKGANYSNRCVSTSSFAKKDIDNAPYQNERSKKNLHKVREVKSALIAVQNLSKHSGPFQMIVA